MPRRLAVPSLGGEFQVAPLTKMSETKIHLLKRVNDGKTRCLAACSILVSDGEYWHVGFSFSGMNLWIRMCVYIYI